MSAPTNLRVEHLGNPLGITVLRPRLSWQLPTSTTRQLAYQVRAGEWDSGRVTSDQSVLVPYGGPALRSGQRIKWTVKVWTDAGESDWASPAWWEMGLLHPEDWTADWIEPAKAEGQRAQSPFPVWYMRGACTLPGSFERARLYATAHGIFEFFINGHRVGDMELTPGFTSYRSTLQVQTFDVADLLVPGENMLGAIVSGGWITWRAWTGLHRELRIGLLAQLHVCGTDGSLTRAVTNPDWVAGSGAIRTADLQQGQVDDLREDQRGWCAPGTDVRGWEPVITNDVDLTRLTGSPAPPVRRVQELLPKTVTRPSPDRQVVDFGQNINGWVRLANLGPVGTTLTLTHGEALDAEGDVSTENVWTAEVDVDPFLEELPWDFALDKAAPFQLDRVTAAGRAGEIFEPRHTTHGFRYVRIEGHPEELGPGDVTGVVVHTDMRRTGWFACSDERINKLHEAVVWSFRGNACDIPTDCPTRERAGWTGDWQIFAPTAAFLFDVAGFSTKWLRDLAAEQQPDGLVGHCAPDPTGLAIETALGKPPGCAGFGDAAVIVPWEIYKAYRDRDLIEEQWESMAAWVDYAARIAREHRHPGRIAERPVPAPHEQYLWDTGFHWGEWNEPGALSELDLDEHESKLRAFTAAQTAADHGAVATAYLHYSARLLSTIAKILGRREDEARYRGLAQSTRSAWQAEFLGRDGAVTPDTQATYVRALAFQLVPEQLRPKVAERLLDLIRSAETHLGTGFLATPYLLPILADNGHLEVAYELLFRDTEPSWLTMIDRGATTIWEHWSGLDERGLPNAPDGVGSLNHYSKGAVISFLHRYTAGIQLLDDAPAYRRFRIAPKPGGGITHARAIHDSPYGRIQSSWSIVDGQFELEVTIPPGTSAEVCLPDGQTFESQPGNARHHCRTTSADVRGADHDPELVRAKYQNKMG